MRAHHGRFPGCAIDVHGHAVRVGPKPNAAGAGAHRDPLIGEDLLYRLRHVLVLAGDQPGCHLDDRDLRAETPIHVGELKPDIASADDDQVPWDGIELEDRRVGEVVDSANPRHVGYACTAADIDEDARRLQQALAHPDDIRALEPSMPFDDGQAIHTAQPLFDIRAGIR